MITFTLVPSGRSDKRKPTHRVCILALKDGTPCGRLQMKVMDEIRIPALTALCDLTFSDEWMNGTLLRMRDAVGCLNQYASADHNFVFSDFKGTVHWLERRMSTPGDHNWYRTHYHHELAEILQTLQAH